MKEKLQEYALIAEIIGGIAIVASLVFVGLQINQNHEMMRAQIRNDIAKTLSERLWNMSESDYINTFVTTADTSTLSPSDQTRVRLFYGSILRLYENIYYQYEIGLFDKTEFEVEASGWKDSINAPPLRQYFCDSSSIFSEGFRNYIYSVMDTPCT